MEIIFSNFLIRLHYRYTYKFEINLYTYGVNFSDEVYQILINILNGPRIFNIYIPLSLIQKYLDMAGTFTVFCS